MVIGRGLTGMFSSRVGLCSALASMTLMSACALRVFFLFMVDVRLG